MGKLEIVAQLENIRLSMLHLKKEARGRHEEPYNEGVFRSRVWSHLIEIEEALVTISYAIKQEIDPHS